MDKTIICDIDGTLANIDHRIPLIEGKHITCKCGEGYPMHVMGISAYCEMCSNCGEISEYTKKDWEAFHEAMKNDTPNQWCVSILWAMVMSYHEHKIIFVTGREEKYRRITNSQIFKWTGLDESIVKLFMRPDADYRPDVEIKREIYEEEIKDKHDILFVLEDRKRVVDMWRSLDFTCLQCGPGFF